MNTIAIVPCAPVLVPELAGAAAEVVELRTAVLAAAAVLPRHWIAVGAGRVGEAGECVVAPADVGTFAGFGADVRVRLSPGAGDDATERPVELPLGALIAAWVRGQARPEANARVHIYAGDCDRETALARGRRLRADIDRASDPVGVLVIADGANTLTAAAPGGYDPSSADAQVTLADALAHGDVEALTRLPGRILGRVAFQVLAGLVEAGPRSAKELYRGAPYGVGYFVGIWQL